MDKTALLGDLREERKRHKAEMGNVLAQVRGEGRSNLDPAELRQFEHAEARCLELDPEIERLENQIRADTEAAAITLRYAPGRNTPDLRTGATMTTETRKPTMPGSAIITREPEIYRREDTKTSFFMDMFNVRQNGDRDAQERLQRNNKMVAERAAKNGEQRAISTSNGSGGEFVPPRWLEDQFVRLARPRRVFADLVQNDPLPGGTDVLSIPKVATGTTTAVQGSQNTAISQTDMTTGSISSAVTTIAGGQTVSLQLIEQSPLNIDDVILGDLAADYARQLDTLCLTGSGTGGNPTGVLTLAGTNAVTFSGTTLTGSSSLYSAIASGISKVCTNRFEAPSAIVMHSRRFMWMLAQQDSQGRPVIVPVEGSPVNAIGTFGTLNAEGPVGQILGVPVFLDNNIATNLGTGTNEDRILILKADDIRLWESHIRAEAFQQVYAQNMSVFVRLYNYMSFQAARYPASISVISGSGLALTL